MLKGELSVLARTVDARATRDIDLLAQETELGAAVEELRRLASVDLGDFMAFRFDKVEPIKSDDEYRSGAKVWFTPSLGGKPLQPLSIDLVVDEVDGLAPEVLKPADRCIRQPQNRHFAMQVFDTSLGSADLPPNPPFSLA